MFSKLFFVLFVLALTSSVNAAPIAPPSALYARQDRVPTAYNQKRSPRLPKSINPGVIGGVLPNTPPKPPTNTNNSPKKPPPANKAPAQSSSINKPTSVLASVLPSASASVPPTASPTALPTASPSASETASVPPPALASATDPASDSASAPATDPTSATTTGV